MVRRTDQATTKVGLWFKLLAVIDHDGTEVCYGQGTVLIVDLLGFGDGLDVAGHGSLKSFHAYIGRVSDEYPFVWPCVYIYMYMCTVGPSLTFMTTLHLLLQRLEIIRHASLHLSTHPLSRPLFEATEFPIHVHDAR